jgi:hypothetical protein
MLFSYWRIKLALVGDWMGSVGDASARVLSFKKFPPPCASSPYRFSCLMGDPWLSIFDGCDACVAESGVRVAELCDKFLRRFVGLVKKHWKSFCCLNRFVCGFVLWGVSLGVLLLNACSFDLVCE